jgi:ABC-type multidrug transport system fused ATPase/permease subunit
VTNNIPALFIGQNIFFSVFIILFMTGYELFKRFAFEQLTSTILRVRKFTINIASGVIICLALVSGSFYLSLNGAHRLIDTSEITASKLDTITTNVSDSISAIYSQRIALKEQQIQAINTNDEDGVLSKRQLNTVKSLENDVKVYETERDNRIAQFEEKTGKKLNKQEDKVKQNSIAFAVMVFFLEFIILIGVAFSAYYTWTSYSEMKSLLATPTFKQLELNLRLLKLYYQNGRKKEQDSSIPRSKLIALANSSKIQCNQKDIDSFIVLCSELEIVTGERRKKVYNMSYEKAKHLIETQEI